jgi:hypothetical protein
MDVLSMSDPCEKCGKPVHGYVEERCCDGRECGCMGLPVTPCWCEECWAKWEAESKARAAVLDESFTNSGEAKS